MKGMKVIAVAALLAVTGSAMAGGPELPKRPWILRAAEEAPAIKDEGGRFPDRPWCPRCVLK